MNLIICGLPGAGKSAISQKLAQTLGWPCFETDCELESDYEKRTGERATCRQIYQRLGDGEFRAWEKKILLAFKQDRAVIDIGGGTLTHPESAEIVKSLGVVIYLKNSPETAFQRVIWKGIPSYLDVENPYDSFIQLVSKREPLYQHYADLTIDSAHLTQQEIVALIIKKMQSD